MKISSVLFVILFFALQANAWNRISELPGPIQQLEMDAQQPGFLVAVNTDRIYCSTDSGEHWQTAAPQGTGNVVIHPKDSRIWALLSEFSNGALTARKLWVSSDHCANFELVRNFDLTRDPQPLRLFADRYDAQMLFATDRDGRALQSTDAGKHWRFLHAPENFGFLQVYSSPLNSDVLYLSGYRKGNYTSGDLALFISHNRGKTWKLLSRDPRGCDPTIFYEDPFFHRILVSECQGTKTLSPATKTKSKALRIYSMVSVPVASPRLFSLQDGKHGHATNLLSTKDGGDTWQKVEGLNGTIIQMRVLNDPEQHVIAITRNGGVYRQPLAELK